MKTNLWGVGCVTLAAAALSACTLVSQVTNPGGTGGGGTTETRPQPFATVTEAAEKGKADLLELLSKGASFDLGVDAATLERSVAGKPIRHAEVGFDQLLTADPSAGFGALISEERGTIVPYLDLDVVSTIVELTPAPPAASRSSVAGAPQYVVAGLAGRGISDSLNAIAAVEGILPESEVTIYEVQNLGVTVFGVTTNQIEMLYLDYPPKFALDDANRAEAVIPALQDAAKAFQATFAEQLRTQKLVR